MTKAPARLRMNPPLGRRPVLQNCRLPDLQVDPVYQRSVDTGTSRTLIRHIAQHWDWNLCQPLVVADRGGGCLFVVDGQHRLAAARLRSDIYDLPCVITSHAGPAEEAATFVALNQHRRPLGALDIFKAALAGGDPQASAVMEMVKRCGLQLAPHTNCATWKPGVIAHVSALAQYHRTFGAAATETSLRLIATAFQHQVLRYAATLHRGLVQVVAELGDSLDFDLMDAVLQGADQAGWIKEVALLIAQDGLDRRRACVTVIRRAYDEAVSECLGEAA